MSNSGINYSLYLVTDVTSAVLGSRDLANIVEQAVKSGVTVVQHRDKHGDTAEIIRTAMTLMAITKRYNVPFIINDRVDIAMAIDADGVHLGQSDMDLNTARRLLGPKKIIGVTVNNIDHLRSAVADGADYVGIGTVFPTQTKSDAAVVLGASGVHSLLEALAECDSNHKTHAVAIGGLNSDSVKELLKTSTDVGRRIDGIAVVSAIISAEDPARATAGLRDLLNRSDLATGISTTTTTKDRDLSDRNILTGLVSQVITNLDMSKPLCHNMTNDVVKYFAANVALAIGASPIMSDNGLEAADLARHQSSLVINMGSSKKDQVTDFVMAVEAYNKASRPTLLDPVGAGATQIRQETVKALLKAGSWTVIKGNESEIQAVVGGQGERSQRGVDSTQSQLSQKERAVIVKQLAIREKTIVVMTGEQDVVSDGHQTYQISNGHPLLGKITGSGCTLGTAIAACLAVEPADAMLATLSALLLFEIAAERAAQAIYGHGGPGSFVPALVDQLQTLAQQTDKNWLVDARVERISD